MSLHASHWPLAGRGVLIVRSDRRWPIGDVERPFGDLVHPQSHLVPSIGQNRELSTAAATRAAAIERQATGLCALSRSIHAEPELAFAVPRSAAKVADLVEAEGFQVERGVAGLDTAFTATYGAGELVIGLCPQALPELGHACGHNIIAASSAGAALALREVADRLSLTIKLIGTPAEESGGGKVLLLQRGVFDDVAMAMMVHPTPDETCASTSACATPSADRAVCDGALALALTGLAAATDDAQREDTERKPN